MGRGKHTDRKAKVVEMYSVIILIATFFMSIAYAEITGTQMNIEGTAIASMQEGVFISNVQYMESDASTDEANSTINYYVESMLESEIQLGTTGNPYITYEVTLYNNTEYEQLFMGVIIDDTDPAAYTNSNIKYSLNIEKEVTTILPQDELKFQITFEYVDANNIGDNTLKSKLNFRFKENPILVIAQDGEIEGIYPGCQPKEYEFIVKNYIGEKVNPVPMEYVFDIEIDKPLTAKIYNEAGEEVSKVQAITGVAEDTTYILKVMWDNTNPEDGILYNDANYSKRTFNCKIGLTATPNGEDKAKYGEYKIQDDINVAVKPVPFSFNVNVSSQNLVIKNGTTSLTMTISNSAANNPFNIKYEIVKEDNANIGFNIGGQNPTNNVIERTLAAGTTAESFDINFTGDILTINPTEILKLRIRLKDSPYIQDEIIYDITIKLHEVIVTLDATGGTVTPGTITAYYGRTYGELPTPVWRGHTFNGWYSAKTGGTKYESTTNVTTNSTTQTLYAQWTSHLLADNVNVGDYVNYPVDYDNVYGYKTTNYKSNLTGWRVWSIEGTGDDKYVRLITAGMPMTYDHVYGSTLAQSQAAVKNLTTNFFNTTLNTTTSTDACFNLCGFKNGSTKITTIAALKALFTNNYTQTTSSGNPAVASMTKRDLDMFYYGDSNNDGQPDSEVVDGTVLTITDVIHLPAVDSTGNYVPYYLAQEAAYNSKYYLYCLYVQGIVVVTGNNHGIRPIVSLKPEVETTGQDTTTKKAWNMTPM